MKPIVKRILAGGILVIVIAALAWPKLDLMGDEAPAQNRQSQGNLSVTAHVAKPERLQEKVLTTGTLRANEEVQLAAEVAGKVTDVLFREGSYVEEGQLLLKINDAELIAQRERAKSRIELAAQQVERQKALLEKGGVSQEEFDMTQNQLRVLESEMALNEAQLAKTEVRAPFSGRLGLRHVSAGSYITPQSRIASLQDISPIKIDFSLPEKYAGLIETGSILHFSIAGAATLYEGTVYAVEPRIDENTRTLQIRATSPNRNGLLTPGAFADIELVLAEHGEALSVPTISVIPELGGKKVFVVKNGLVEERSVETGIRTSSDVQIISGIAEGDTVLTSGLQLARTGLPVDVTVEQATEGDTITTIVPADEMAAE